MSSPVSEGKATGTQATATTSHTITFDTSPTSGDLLLLGIVFYDETAVSTLSGWTKLFSYDIDASSAESIFEIWYRGSDGTEGTSDTLTTDVSTKSAYSFYRFSSASLKTSNYGSPVRGSSGTDPDPPPLDSSLTSFDDFYQVPFAAWVGDFTVSSYPTNYTTDQQYAATSGGSDCGIGSAKRLLTSDEDPSTFTLSSTTKWAAATLVVEYSAGGAPIIGSGSPTEDDDTSAGSGSMDISGSAAITESEDIGAGTVSLGQSTEDADASAGSGGVSVAGTAAITEAGDINEVDAYLPPKEGADISSGTGTVSVAGSAVITEDADEANALTITGSMAATEAGDDSNGVGDVQTCFRRVMGCGGLCPCTSLESAKSALVPGYFTELNLYVPPFTFYATAGGLNYTWSGGGSTTTVDLSVDPAAFYESTTQTFPVVQVAGGLTQNDLICDFAPDGSTSSQLPFSWTASIQFQCINSKPSYRLGLKFNTTTSFSWSRVFWDPQDIRNSIDYANQYGCVPDRSLMTITYGTNPFPFTRFGTITAAFSQQIGAYDDDFYFSGYWGDVASLSTVQQRWTWEVNSYYTQSLSGNMKTTLSPWQPPAGFPLTYSTGVIAWLT